MAIVVMKKQFWKLDHNQPKCHPPDGPTVPGITGRTTFADSTGLLAASYHHRPAGPSRRRRLAIRLRRALADGTLTAPARVLKYFGNYGDFWMMGSGPAMASAKHHEAARQNGENASMSTGKRAVVTGGANGIGQAFCKRLAAQGAKIVIADIADCSETVGAIKKRRRRRDRRSLRSNLGGRGRETPAGGGKGARRLRHPRALRRHLSDRGNRRDHLRAMAQGALGQSRFRLSLW